MKDIQIYSWESFKEVLSAKKLWLQYVDTGKSYSIFAVDEVLVYVYTVAKLDPRDDEQADFEDNYKAEANRPLTTSLTATQSKFIGKKVHLNAEDESGYVEWVFGQDVYISKVLPVVNAQFGDYIECEVYLIDPEMSLMKYAETIYLNGTHPNTWFEGSGAGKIPLGCKVRATYYKAAGAERDFILIAEFLI
jgi:hypothetical protein